MKVPGKFPVAILVGLAACTWVTAGALVYGMDAGWSFFKPFTIVVAVIAAVLAGYDRFLWKLPVFSAAHDVPNLNGTWLGDRSTLWKDPKTGIVPPDAKSVMVIRQTFTSITVMSFTAESLSMSVAAGIAREADGGRLVVTYVFRNEPKLPKRPESPTHYGGARLDIGGNKDVLSGHYWTDRDSKGTATFKRVSKDHALDFESGLALAGISSAAPLAPAGGSATAVPPASTDTAHENKEPDA
jgi:hypothetical protein